MKIRVLDLCYQKDNKELLLFDTRALYVSDDIIERLISNNFLIFYHKGHRVAIHDSAKYFELKIIINEEKLK